ncbi:MAG: hypothetical protein HUU26_03800 [Gemmatimonadaceae bacterium]|nr:hypothetical protein [Gemmatimonadaceae bacterium]
MSQTRLDPEEALAGPLYAVAGLLIAMPVVDFVLSVAAPAPSSVQWRFAAVGLLSGFTLTPILGMAVALTVAAVRQHYLVQRLLVATSLLGSVVLLVLCAGFILDVLQLRVSIPAEGQAAFRSAWTRALLKHLLAAVVLAYLGWRARRMIPKGHRPREPRTVHVVTK